MLELDDAVLQMELAQARVRHHEHGPKVSRWRRCVLICECMKPVCTVMWRAYMEAVLVSIKVSLSIHVQRMLQCAHAQPRTAVTPEYGLALSL